MKPTNVSAVGCMVALLALCVALEANAGVDPDRDTPIPVDVVSREDLAQLPLDITSVLDQVRAAPLPPPVLGTEIVLDETDLGEIPIDIVEQVEVLRGPSGAVWGASGDSQAWCSYTGGVINIISRRSPEGLFAPPNDTDPAGDPLDEFMRDWNRTQSSFPCSDDPPEQQQQQREVEDPQASASYMHELEESWSGLSAEQIAVAQAAEPLRKQLAQARAAGNSQLASALAANVAALEQVERALEQAGTAVAEELNRLDAEVQAKTDALRDQLAQAINKAAGPEIDRRIAAADSLQGVKEGVTGVTSYLSSGSEMQCETAKTTRLADRERITAEEKLTAIDKQLADPALPAESRAILQGMRARLQLQLQGAEQLLDANGTLTFYGYCIDVGSTVCGAKLVQVGERLLAKALLRGAARRAVARQAAAEAVEGGTTSIATKVMKRPPIDARTIGEKEVKAAVGRARRLAREKYDGDFHKALDEVMDEVLGTDVLNLPITAETEAVRKAMDAARELARRAMAERAKQIAESVATGPNGTGLLSGFWKSAAGEIDPYGMTTVFGLSGEWLAWSWLQSGFDQDPVLAERTGPDSFRVMLPYQALLPNEDRSLSLREAAPLTKLWSTKIGSYPPAHSLKLSFDIGGLNYEATPETAEAPPGATGPAERNVCRDKQIAAPPEWRDGAVAVAFVSVDQAPAEARVRLVQ